MLDLNSTCEQLRFDPLYRKKFASMKIHQMALDSLPLPAQASGVEKMMKQNCGKASSDK
jgi:hypothetical protein